MIETQERECPNQAECLGDGFDSFTENFCNNIAIKLDRIDEKKLKKQAEEYPLEEFYSFDQIENACSLSELLNVSGTVSGEGFLLGSVPCMISANTKGAYFSSKTIKEESLYILLNYQVKNNVYRITNPELSDRAKNILNSSKSAEFKKKFGDEFIIGFRTSAEYTALIEVLLNEKEKKNNIFFEINAMISSLLAMATGDFTIRKNHEKTENLKKFNTNEDGLAITLDELIDDFRKFKKNLSINGCVKSSAIFAEYDRLIDVPRDIHILTPELKFLKSKLIRLKNKKIKKELELFKFENKLRFESNSDLVKEENQKILELNGDIYKINDFIERCLFLPDLVETKEYEEYLKL
jgi:hypothetical protein